MHDLARLRRISFDPPPSQTHDLKLWVRQGSDDGSTESLPTVADVRCGERVQTVDRATQDSQALVPLNGSPCQVTPRRGVTKEA